MKVRPARVMHLTHDMGVGGAEQVIRQLVIGADPTRYECSVLCTDGQIGPIGADLRERGFAVDALSRRPGFDRALIRALRERLRAERVDVLHCHQYTPYSYGVLAALEARRESRVVFTEHGRFHPDRHSWKRRLINPVLARFTDEIVAISSATRDALVHHEWLPRRRIRLIYNGVTPPVRQEGVPSVRRQLGIDEATLVLGTISRLDPIKNQAMMLDALAAVRRRQLDCVLILAGDGPERDALERRVVELGLDGAVFFTGFVSDIAAHLDAIDVFLLTSWSEGTSMTLLEAMSFAKPVIATRVGGNVEILEEGRSALLIDAGDVSALADAVGRLADDAGLQKRLGRGAQACRAERFEPQGMVAAYEALYSRLVVATSAPGR